jgi:hypothetical protein
MDPPQGTPPEKPAHPLVVRWFLRLLPTLRPEAACAYSILVVYVVIAGDIPRDIQEGFQRDRSNSLSDPWGGFILGTLLAAAGCVGLILPWLAMLGSRQLYARFGWLVFLTNMILMAMVLCWAASEHLGSSQTGGQAELLARWVLAALCFGELFVVVYGGMRFLDLPMAVRRAHLGVDVALQTGLWLWEILLVLALIGAHGGGLMALPIAVFALLAVHALAISAMGWMAVGGQPTGS